MKFSYVAQVFDAVEQESSRTSITVLLADLFKKATSSEASAIAYFALGELNPPYIGTQFGMAEKSLIKIIAVLLDKSPEQIKSKLGKQGDLGLVVAQGEWAGGGDHLSVTDVGRSLHQLLEISGTGSQDVREKKVLQLLTALDVASAKYVVRIISSTLRLGFSDMTLLDAFSWMHAGDKSLRPVLEHAYNISADIGLIIKTLKQGGEAGLEQLAITPGIPIRPAAAERSPDAASVIKRLGPCVAQPKLDGFRLQVHIDNHQGSRVVRFFSRNLQDMSHMFPDLVASLADLEVKSMVAEGEAICINPETGDFLPFQETVKRKRKHDVDMVAKDFPLKLFLFDLLYLNGKPLLDLSHEQRRELLLDLCNNKTLKKHGVIQPIEEVTVTNADELYHYFEENISLGLEGLVVKRPDAIYQPGKRNFNWIKLKREENGSLDDTIDCVMLGYYHGQGKRAAFGIGALLVGVYNKKHDAFQTIAKLGTGFTDVEWKAVRKDLDGRAVAQKPRNVECSKELYPDVWVTPTVVCMVRADEITLSPLHTAGITSEHAGYALRFPRFMGYRPDKSATAATEIAEIKRLFDLQFEKKKR